MTEEKPIIILIAEDNEVDRTMLLKACEQVDLPIHAFAVEDGKQALDFLFNREVDGQGMQNPKPDILLLDLMMPNVSGHEVLEALRKDSEYRDLPVLILTASEDDQDMMKSLTHGAFSFIQKPIEFDNFEHVMQRFMSHYKFRQ